MCATVTWFGGPYHDSLCFYLNTIQKILRFLVPLAMRSSFRNKSECPGSCSVSWLKPRAGEGDKNSGRASAEGPAKEQRGVQGRGGLWWPAAQSSGCSCHFSPVA